jgi:sulfate adenylyltransferase
MGAFKEPHGGELKELYLTESGAEQEKLAAGNYPNWNLTDRQLCDIELLLNGAFSPLEGFLSRAAYDSVLAKMRLPSGLVWPIPITLDVTREFAGGLKEGDRIAMRDPEGVLIATMEVSNIWEPDKALEARSVFGTEDLHHPGVYFLQHRAGPIYLGGTLRGVEPPMHYDFKILRDSPSELRGRFRKLGWRKVVAFQTRNPMHRAHQELTLRAARETEANLLLHPVVGMTRPGDIDHYTRVRCYEHMLKHYPEQTSALSLLNLAMRMAGPKEALWHAIIRKNFGCTHLIVGRDHAGPGAAVNGVPYYEPYAAQQLL